MKSSHKNYVLAVDQGTTSSRALLFDQDGRCEGSHQIPLQCIYPQSGYVLQNPDQLYQSVIDCVSNVIKSSGINPQQIISAGITNQRETLIAWHAKTGKAFYPAIVWQSRQSASIIVDWQRKFGLEYFSKRSGLHPDAYFSASKIAWILKNVPEAAEALEQGLLKVGTVDTWLLWNLSKGSVYSTDVTNASRTMLFNLDAQQWDTDLCRVCGIKPEILPEVKENIADFGAIPASVAGVEIPITAVAGDQHAALFGQACFSEGMVKNTYGTGCFMLMHTGTKRVEAHSGLLSTMAWKINGVPEFALEGSVFVAGSAVQWIRDELALVTNASETEALAVSLEDNGGVYLVPAFTGLGAPYWDADARGAFLGMTRGTSRAHLVRATLESLAYQTRDVLELMEEVSKIKITELRVDGGASSNNFLMQFQANQLSCLISRPKQTESTVWGVAMMSGLGSSFWSGKEALIRLHQIDAEFKPELVSNQENERWYAQWKRAVSACRAFTAPI
ncbi:MAG: glycerol kinase GlpK [Bacteroidia bacterium]|jgi:glycerol kinase